MSYASLLDSGRSSDTGEENLKKYATFPNALTGYRAFLGAPFVIAAILYGYEWWALFLFVVGAMTDMEGFLARALQGANSFGAIFDPIADKVYTDLLLILLVFVEPNALHALLALVVIGYDLDNTWSRRHDIYRVVWLGEEIEQSLPATRLSKCKTGVLSCAVGLGLLSQTHGIIGWLASVTGFSYWEILQTVGNISYGFTFAALVMVGSSWIKNRVPRS